MECSFEGNWATEVLSQLQQYSSDISFSDHLVYYNFIAMSPSCDLPTVQPTDFIILDSCTPLNTIVGERDTLLLSRVPNQVKTGKIRILVQGLGIDCSPANGIHMISISTGGNLTHCKTSAGHSNNFGKITCSYFCSCSPGCVLFRVAITDLADKVICAFVIWLPNDDLAFWSTNSTVRDVKYVWECHCIFKVAQHIKPAYIITGACCVIQQKLKWMIPNILNHSFL